MVTHDDLAEHVIEALRSFYDPVRLRLNPLIELLRQYDQDGKPSPAVLRATLRSAIASLQPDSSVPLQADEWLTYRILWLRYVQRQSREAVCAEIGLSQASYYRRRAEALAALAELLWDRYHPAEQPVSLSGESHNCAQIAITEGLRMMSQCAAQSVAIDGMLQSAVEMLDPLTRNKGITLRLAIDGRLPMMYGHPTLLRQKKLYLLTKLLNIPGGSELDIVAAHKGRAVVLTVRRSDVPGVYVEAFDRQDGARFCEGILNAYGGRLRLQSSERELIVRAELPIHEPKTILVIDDDTDVLLLYKRYLEGFLVEFARREDEVRAALAMRRPNVILLDLLMPEKDGWDILRYIRGIQQYADIPILVCSVLSQPQLAIAMGATHVLQKPIDQETLLAAIRPLVRETNRPT